MAALKTLTPGTAVLSVQSLSQAVVVLFLRAVLSVVLVCLACRSWGKELICGALRKTCCKLSISLLTYQGKIQEVSAVPKNVKIVNKVS